MLHLIGGEKGGVGKSVLARILCQYFIDSNRSFQGFDADLSHPALGRYYTDFTKTVDLMNFESCDQLLFGASEGTPAIVDLPAQSERHLRKWIDESGVTELSSEMGLRIIRWHVMDDGKDSIKLLEELLGDPSPAMDYVIVKNQGCGQNFHWMEKADIVKQAHKMGVSVINLPALHHNTMNKIDGIDASFWAACNNTRIRTSLNILERQRVKVWLRRSYHQLQSAHPSLRFGTEETKTKTNPPKNKDTKSGAIEHSLN